MATSWSPATDDGWPRPMPSTKTVSPRPVDGSQPSITAKTMIIISPTQKVGRLKPKIEPAIIVRLSFDSGFNPA